MCHILEVWQYVKHAHGIISIIFHGNICVLEPTISQTQLCILLGWIEHIVAIYSLIHQYTQVEHLDV